MTPIHVFYASGGFLLALYLLGNEPSTNSEWLFTALLTLVAMLLPILPFMLNRPFVIVDKTGLHFYISRYFRSRIIQRVYLMYSIEALSEAIDYLNYGPLDIARKDIKHFKMRKRRGLYEVRAITNDHKGFFVCSTYKKESAKATKKSLETFH